MDRKRMEEVARRRAPKRPKILDMQNAQGMTGGEAITRMLGDVQAEPAKEPRQKIVLYLKEGLNAAASNFTKYPNGMHPVMTEHLNKEYEGILYIYLWRKSFGYGRNYCRTSYLDIQKNTLIGSRKTAQRAIAILAEKHFVIRAKLDGGVPNVNQQGALYRIMTPDEIKDQRTEEGVPFVELPLEGVVCQAIPSPTIAENIDNSRIPEGMASHGMASEAIGRTDHTPIDHTTMDPEAIPSQAIPGSDRDNDKAGAKHGLSDHTPTGHPFKEDSLKDSLSPDPVKTFYTGIGQKRISQIKRERGNKVVEELKADGFSLEDIAYAAEWTPKNAKEKLYDMEILKHTIGEAISASTAEQQAADREREEAARVRAAEEEQRRLEGEIQKMRSRMTENELVELKEMALKEIRNTDGVKEQFIGEPLIVAKENEILQRREKRTPAK